MNQYIKFRDLQNNQVYYKRDAITAVVIMSPLNPDKNTHSFITCGTVASSVSPEVAAWVVKELESPVFNES
jgi:hypothetical protein